MDNIKKVVNELAKWDALMADGRKEMNKHKLSIQNEAASALENSKVKQVKFYGDDSNCAIVTTAEKVELVSIEYLRGVIPENILKDFAKEEIQYKLTAPFKNVVGPLVSGNYTERKVLDIIEEMNLSEGKAKVAKKKLKGNFEKDVEFLKTIGHSQEEAEHWAYFITEAAAWERIVNFMEVSGYEEGTPGFQDAIKKLKHAVIVDETLKIGVEYEKDE
ncbi:hypothetical protein Amet_4388 [Alkaliphilus metalliredigens QYMF]|uniref:Uncharacterized protein n=1 Tax=Alkaliphilus metalliredigens (strain QYMF) TaxID=293826 RepID=A6TKA4_ALKMQ|nr:hypothetical protein [Alkaliphilus metalliredigens]ABR46622.1 hypothetical protein Amet_0394 [Alkaliphilus metalliredigens QYMF]ABR48095.1 hypothetical protein Amet_1932 [Alkaliphilus metalliredigens QYMF]ABR50462.1 hypothetical protein Amet_4388 [Alkaliphilus metalliredigens QYMF]